MYLPAFAEPVRKLSWEDLVPAHLLTDGPFADLTQEQLDLVVWVLNLHATYPAWVTAFVESQPDIGVEEIEKLYFSTKDRTKDELASLP